MFWRFVTCWGLKIGRFFVRFISWNSLRTLQSVSISKSFYLVLITPLSLIYYPGQKKNRYSQEIHEVDRQFDHVISCDIELWFGRHRRDLCVYVSARRELALQIKVDVAWYHMIALRINLMNISAVTIFLARVVTLTFAAGTYRISLRCKRSVLERNWPGRKGVTWQEWEWGVHWLPWHWHSPIWTEKPIAQEGWTDWTMHGARKWAWTKPSHTDSVWWSHKRETLIDE